MHVFRYFSASFEAVFFPNYFLPLHKTYSIIMIFCKTSCEDIGLLETSDQEKNVLK